MHLIRRGNLTAAIGFSFCGSGGRSNGGIYISENAVSDVGARLRCQQRTEASRGLRFEC